MIVKFNNIEEKIITIRNQKVIIDSDVAELYGVQTRDINKSVKNNPDKFPFGYIFELNKQEVTDLRWKISTTNLSPKSRALPKAFTEKGLYMLATILKSEKATQTTIAIIETFTKIRELSRTIAELSEIKDENEQKSLMQKSGEIISDILGEDMKTTDTETTVELNFAVLKFKHTIKRKNDQ
ncbi:MAG: ORF6N domain-containing protein [Flavobacteriaceae bacterium]